MSFKEANQMTSNPKLLSGCGDGLKNYNEKELKRKSRNQIPSCRRFSTRPIPKQQDKTNQVKEQLERAIIDLSRHPGITHRRAHTMAEITPTKNYKDNKLTNTPLNLSLTRSFEGASISCNRTEDAGRRIYQLLLLNAWRRRKIQVVALSDSQASLQTQIDKLELQIDALRRLRQSECEKRSEAVSEVNSLQNHVQDIVKEQKSLQDKNAALETEMEMVKIENRKMQLCVQNCKNDWNTALNDVRHLEHQLEVERENIKKLRFEKKSLLDEISQRDQDVRVQNEKILNMDNNVKNLDFCLQEAIFNNNGLENEKSELLKKLDVEIAVSTNFESKCKDLQVSKDSLELKVHEMRKFINAHKEIKKKLEDENQQLLKRLNETIVALKAEQQRPWWKNASQLALASLRVLQNAGYIMLPAYPNINKTTSTTGLTAAAATL